MSVHITFEALRDTLVQLDPPQLAGERSTYWVVPRKLGLAKTADAALEIFIVGPKLYPRTPTVSRHLEFARWEISESGEQLDANRVVLPSAPHFVAIAALIAVELDRAGIDDGRPIQEVLDDVEPIIELSLRRGALSEEHLIGLVGELLCLEAMLDAIADRPELRMSILDMWEGPQVGHRDFVIGISAIEVKTTRQESSSHKISGLHQVERAVSTHHSEENLFLLSIGLAASEHEGQTLPEIVQRVSDRLADSGAKEGTSLTPLQHRFLDDVARYGAGASRGYDHRTMSAWNIYGSKYRATFTPRLYDLLDEEVRIIRRLDLTGTHVSPDDIQYRLELPPLINGGNPASSWRHAVVGIVKEHLHC
ncbi:PD-(D/E)XK motif protein [Cupriavidus taiwanensis]|uniref:PD-(D/E)XK motif protein n=1 Tax=Cupriavidus taiwanensis TaxID=164546 RepID=UPI001574093E|nr:PD-(D/E)XK motif protein [Cupriavidus taiwanensis]NSX16070.1 PD-(D/E)XK motif protein [Cupriavidus taiwanensis]